MVNKVLLVLSGILIPLGVIFKFLLEKVIMPVLTRPCVMPSVWEQIVWTEANKVEFADIWVIEMVSHLQSHVQRIIAVLSHQLVQFFANVIHNLLLKYR